MYPDSVSDNYLGLNSISSKMVFGGALLCALILHTLIALFFLNYSFGPKAHIVDDSSYRVSVSNRVLEPVSESVIEPLTHTKDDKVLDPIAPKPLSKEQPKTKKAERLEKPQEKKPTPKIDSPTNDKTIDNKLVTSAPAKTKAKKPAKDTPAAPMVNETNKAVESESEKTEPEPTIAKPAPAEKEVPKHTVQTPVEQFRSPSYELGSPTNPRPPYPSMAAKRGWEGDVVLGVYVDAEGQVTYVEILETSNVSALDFSAYSTVYEQWSFSPADAHEINLRGYVRVPISFRR